MSNLSLARLGEQICAEYDRLSTLGRDIDAKDWATYDVLSKQLWGTRSRSIDDVIAKARVLDHSLRIAGEPHSILKDSYGWNIVDDLLAMAVQS